MLVQSTRFETYQAALANLRDRDLVYPCWASRAEIAAEINAMPGGAENWPRDPDGAPVYPGIYRDITTEQRQSLMWRGGSYAWRLRMDRAIAEAEKLNGGPLFFTELSGGTPQRVVVEAQLFGDVVLARKDVPTSYHLSVVIDDAEQNITHVTRGRDLMAAPYSPRASAFAGPSGTAIFSPRTGARHIRSAPVETGRRPRFSGVAPRRIQPR